MEQSQNFEKLCGIYKWLNTYLQLNKLETAAKNQAEVVLGINIKASNGNNLPLNYYQQQDKQLI